MGVRLDKIFVPKCLLNLLEFGRLLQTYELLSFIFKVIFHSVSVFVVRPLQAVLFLSVLWPGALGMIPAHVQNDIHAMAGTRWSQLVGNQGRRTLHMHLCRCARSFVLQWE
eukprot:s2994_g13.t1